MKLSELVTHTSLWTGIPRTAVESHARYLREAGLLTSGGRGLAAPDMSDKDKISLLISVCGISVATEAPVELKKWLQCKPDDHKAASGFQFAFAKQATLPAALLSLIKVDLRSEELKAWRKGDRENLEKLSIKSGVEAVSVLFEVDAVSARIELLRIFSRQTTEASQTIRVSFTQAARPKPSSYRARAQFTCRLSEEILVGWGECLQTADT